MRLSNKVVLASMNRGKLDEFRHLLSPYSELELVPASELVRNPEQLGFVERHDTYLENAAAKARLVNDGCHYPTLADDSGLEVDALGGKPGVRSHRYASPKPRMTQDQANLEYLLSELKGSSNRSARFVCTVVLVIEGILLHATATLEGSIAEAPRGTLGFGYDPVFIPRDSNKTLGEIAESEKNKISHRAKALHDLMSQIKNHGITFAKP